MSAQRRQFLIGFLFLVIGVLLILLAVSPVIIGLLSKPRVHGDVSLAFLAIGVSVAVFGAWLVPSSGAGPVVQQIITVAGPYIPRIGGSRAGDPPQPPKVGSP